MGVKVENEGKDVVIRFPLKDEYLEVLDDRIEHHTSRRLTEGEKIQVICELLRHAIEVTLLEDWSWFLVDSSAREVAEDVIRENDDH